MLVTANILIKTEDGHEALTQRRHDVQMRQWHLLIPTDGACTVGQLYQLLSDWPDLDDLLVGLQRVGMVDMLLGISPENIATAPPFDSTAHFNRPLFNNHGSLGPAVLSHIYDELPLLTGTMLGLQAVAALIDGSAINDTDKPHTASVQIVSAPQPVVPPELTDVLSNVVEIELMRLAAQHFGSAVGTAMPLLRACKRDPQPLRDVVAACTRAAAPLAGEHAAAKFVDAAMQVMALRR